MIVSQFSEYVDKYFGRIVGAIVEKFNGKASEDKYLHKTLLTEDYSADLSWGTTEINHSVVAADVVALDSPLPLKKRATLSNATGKLPKIGVKYRKGEQLITDINVSKARGTSEATIVAKVFDDVTKCIRSMDTEKEILFRRALSTGEILVKDDANEGTAIRASFGYKAENMLKATAAWSATTATPKSDLQKVFDKAEEDGVTITDVFITKKYLDLFRNSSEGKLMAANYNRYTVTNDKYLSTPSRQMFLEVLADEFDATFHMVTGSFKVQGYDGTEKVADAWKEDNIVAVPDNVVGRLVYGTLAEETNPVADVAYQKAGSHVLISKYSKVDPLEEYTTAQALCLPVIDNAESVYILSANETE